MSDIAKYEQRFTVEPEFLQALNEVYQSLTKLKNKRPDLFKNNILDRLADPDRIITFKVSWQDDGGNVHVNRGYRVQYNNAIGPYKGGLRFHPSVNTSTLKFLAFEQTFKNALTGLPIGGAKGGSDFDPKGKSDKEIMNFCQSFMNELVRYIGPTTDIPAGDMGVGSREIGYLFGQYKKIRNRFDGSLNGKDITMGGLQGRTQATGYGLCYIVDALLKDNQDSFMNKKVIVSGSGNVAIYAAEKAMELGATVIAMSDSGGVIKDEQGIDIALVKALKEVRRERISQYCETHPDAEYIADPHSIYTIACDIALPCAIQNELDEESARELVENGCRVVAEGANMPSTQAAIEVFREHRIWYLPGKAANAGGVACSTIEMNQNASHDHYSFKRVDDQLKDIMNNIYRIISEAAREYGEPHDYVIGANVAGFIKVATAMQCQGIF